MINEPPPFKGLNIGIPFKFPKGRVFFSQGSGLIKGANRVEQGSLRGYGI